MATRSSHHYSSLSHIPRAKLATSPPHSYGGSSEILSQPVGFAAFDMDPQVWDMGYENLWNEEQNYESLQYGEWEYEGMSVCNV